MKFALFFLGEYTHMLTTSFLVVAVFFGGWDFFGVDLGSGPAGIVLRVLVLAGKMGLFIVFYMLIRWTIPRFRFDQLMGLAWKVMMPLGLVNLIAVLAVKHFNLPVLWLLPVSVVVFVAAAWVSLLMPKAPARVQLPRRAHPSATRTVVMQ
jgi:NADH-quinone oxidoreductase subunit H